MYFVPTTRRTEFNLLNFMEHVAGTKINIPQIQCCTSSHERTYPWEMCPQHFHLCACVVILSLLRVTSVYTTQVFFFFFSLQHDPSCLPTLKRSNRDFLRYDRLFELSVSVEIPSHPSERKANNGELIW